MKTFYNAEAILGNWTFSTTFDLGRWQFGPDILIRDGWQVYCFSIGPWSVSVEWFGMGPGCDESLL